MAAERPRRAGDAPCSRAGGFPGGEAARLPHRAGMGRRAAVPPAKPPTLCPATGGSAAATGGRRSRLPALRMTQRWMKSWAAVRRCSRIPRRTAPWVSADAFEDSLRGTQGDRSCLDSPCSAGERCWSRSRASGAGLRRDLPGQPAQSPARAHGLSQAHPLPCPPPKPKSNYPSRRLSHPPQTQTAPLPSADKQPQPWVFINNPSTFFSSAPSQPTGLAGLGLPAGHRRPAALARHAPRPRRRAEPPLQSRLALPSPLLPREDRARSSARCLLDCACAPAPLTTAANERSDNYFWEAFDFHQSGEWLLVADKGFDNFSFRRGETLVIKSWIRNAAHRTAAAPRVAGKLCCRRHQ